MNSIDDRSKFVGRINVCRASLRRTPPEYKPGTNQRDTNYD